MPESENTTKRPRVVIVGAGFGGLAAAQGLAASPVDVVLLDRRNYHLFQPLLYQVATAGLSPADIAWPIRSILRTQDNVSVELGAVTGVDTVAKEVVLGDTRVGYDYLILATGARHAYFGHREWEPFAPGLKRIEDATTIRRRILLAFEKAESGCDAEERRRLMNFVVVGGGATGVEMAGAIAELARKALALDFRQIDPRTARIVLVEAGPRLLPSFPANLSEFARRSLEELDVEVLLGQAVTRCDAEGVAVGDTRIEAATVIWAAGVMASPAATWLGVESDKAGRAFVEPDFSVKDRPEVFVVGDSAHLEVDGRMIPGVAPAAKQAGRYVANVIDRRIRGRAAPPPFRYRDWGNLATIGRKSAVVSMGRLSFKGFPAWLLWSVAHVYFLIGLRNRIVVALNWLWSYLTFERGARLITGIDAEDTPAAAPARDDKMRKAS
jgi:NADH dehydrogenase